MGGSTPAREGCLLWEGKDCLACLYLACPLLASHSFATLASTLSSTLASLLRSLSRPFALECCLLGALDCRDLDCGELVPFKCVFLRIAFP